MAIPTVTFWNKDGRSVIINRHDLATQEEWRKAGFSPEGETVVEEEPQEEVEVDVELEEETQPETEEAQEDKEAAEEAAGEVKRRQRPSRSEKKK